MELPGPTAAMYRPVISRFQLNIDSPKFFILRTPAGRTPMKSPGYCSPRHRPTRLKVGCQN